MRKLLVFTLLILGIGSQHSFAQGWEPLGEQPLTANIILGSRLATDNGVVYALSQNSEKSLTVQQFTGGVWSTVGDLSFLPPVADFSQLVAADGELWLAVTEDVPGRPHSVVRFNGTEWAYAGPSPINADRANSPALTVRGGKPLLVYQEAVSDQLQALAFDGDVWSLVGDLGGVASSGWNPDVYVSEEDVAYVSFRRFLGPGQNELAVAVLDGEEWSLLGGAAVTPLEQNSDGSNPLVFSDLATDSGGVVYVSYRINNNNTTNSSFELLITERFVSGGWEPVGQPVGDAALDNQKSHHLAFYDGRPTVSYPAFGEDLVGSATPVGVSVVTLNAEEEWIKLPGTNPFAGEPNTTNPIQWNWMAASENGRELYVSYAPNWPNDGRLNVLRYVLKDTTTNVVYLGDDVAAINAWPNPTTGRVFLEEATTYEVFDAYGRSVSRGVDRIIDLSGLPAAVYHLKLRVASGVWASRKVIKR